MDGDCQENVNSLEDVNSHACLMFTEGICCYHVAYIHSEDYLLHCNQFCKVIGRAGMVHSLIDSYGLLNYVRVLAPDPAAEADLALFHSSSYLHCLKRLSDGKDADESEEEEFGLSYDCPSFKGVFECCQMVAGGSISAANCIIQNKATIAVNWFGGWHHAKKDEASGFCYVNDVVLCILKLLTKFSRVLYVDLDLHHGDGVEDAFCATAKVMTVSFHKHSPGFFPGSGSVKECGIGKGKYFAVNVPLKDGIDDQMYAQVFNRVIDLVIAKFCPDAIVCQCGADGLAGDPEAGFNLTPQVFIHCVNRLLQLQRPMVLLGGGGYNFANTARCWTSILASLVGASLRNEIPDEEKYFTKYGSCYELKIHPGNMRNANTVQYIDAILSTIKANLSHIS